MFSSHLNKSIFCFKTAVYLGEHIMKNLSEKEIIKFLENSPHIQQQIDQYKEGQCYLLVHNLICF